jgi:hypothetical protein
MATTEVTDEFMETLDRNRLRFVHPKVKNAFSKWNKSIQYIFPDLERNWYFELSHGEPGPLIEGTLDQPDVVYEMDTTTFFKINNKEISGMKAYNQKLVKVKAKMPDLLKLQKLDKV